jgi:hypothetical protein
MILLAMACLTSSAQSPSPQGDADLFERYTQDTQRFLIDLFTV